jgi:cyanophycin synthetase
MDQFHQTKHDARDFENSERLLINRALDAAVIETSAHHILNEGLAYDRCQVGVVTDMPPIDQSLIDAHDIIDAEKLRTVIRTQVDLVLPTGATVLNAEDDTVAGLAELSDGEVIFYAQNAQNQILVTHLSTQGRAVYLDGNEVVLARGQQENRLLSFDLPLIARLLELGFEKRTLLATIAIAWALDIHPPLIRAGLKNFGQQQQAAKDNARING